ncbi:glycosyltransferase family 2 protein [Rhodopseudomonas sp. G2_2311]|uniref:glycosyltransferase family 2 protein n=1 Tax=Rhodopseudomonas sp. G2_2311 TaxID=3114287 RepID=UPI0039C5C31E
MLLFASHRYPGGSAIGKFSFNKAVKVARLQSSLRIAAVVPCYKSKKTVLNVICAIGQEIETIIIVDDACPEGTGPYAKANSLDPRLLLIEHKTNQGVGGAVISGYRAAIERGFDIVVKIDSDGQMDPALVPSLVRSIEVGIADYVKGNRFFNPEDAARMPFERLIGNLGLSFLTKLSAGYWDIFDPTNGFTAIHRSALKALPLEKLSRRYFFETDMLFRLNIAGAVVVDMPMTALYGDEVSNLSPIRSLFSFTLKHIGVFGKRVAYRYFIRDFNLGSIDLIFACLFLLFGLTFGLHEWWQSLATGNPATAGTVMLAALPLILGVQFTIGFWAQDCSSVPRTPLQLRVLEKP